MNRRAGLKAATRKVSTVVSTLQERQGIERAQAPRLRLSESRMVPPDLRERLQNSTPRDR
eukprot:3401845-Prymnesium_polylepis.2